MATLKNTNDLLSQAASTLPDNSTQEISPQDVREMAENTAFSSYNKVTDEPIVGLSEYNGAFVYPLGKAVIFEGSVYQANTTTTPGTFTPSEWDLISSGGGSENLETQSTGIKSGGLISINGGDNTRFDLAAGEAIIIDNSDLTNVTKSHVVWTAQTSLIVGSLATEPRTNVGISLNNNPVPNVTYTNSFNATVNGTTQLIFIAEKSTDDFNSAERRLFASLGRLVHTAGTSITNAVNLQQTVNSPLSSVLDFINLFPAQNVEGNEFSGNALALSVAKTAGKGFRFGSNYSNDTNDPNTQDIPAADPTTHFYRYQDGAGGFSQSASSNFLDPANYDNGTGTLATVAPNRWTVQPVWVFAGSGTMFVQYGQTEYSSKEAAISAIPTASPTLDENLVTDAVFRGYFIIKQGATDLSLTTEFEWRAPLGEIGGGQGAGVVVDLQQAYNASIDPEITTDSTRGALTIRRGSAADTDAVLEIQNGAGSNTLSITGDGTFNLGVNTDFELNGNKLRFQTSNAELELGGSSIFDRYLLLGANTAADGSGYYAGWDGSNGALFAYFGANEGGGYSNKTWISNKFDGGPMLLLANSTGAADGIWFNVSNGSGSGDGTTSKRKMFVSNTQVSVQNVSNFIVDPNNTTTPAAIGSEVISLQDRTAVFGTDTLPTSTAFEIYDGDTTPSQLWDFRNNGDLYVNQSSNIYIPSTGINFRNATNEAVVNLIADQTTDYAETRLGFGGNYMSLSLFGSSVRSDLNNKQMLVGLYNHGPMVLMNKGALNNAEIWFNISNGSSSDGLASKRRLFVSNTTVAAHNIDGMVVDHASSGTPTVNASAAFEVVSTTKGILFPRMTAVQASAVTGVDGLTLYVTSTDATFTSVGFWGYENGAWVKL